MCFNPITLAKNYYFVLTKTTKDDWQNVFNNLGLVQALILSACYGVSGWIEYPSLVECGLAGEFYTYVSLVQQPGLAGVVLAILMVQLAGMASTNETKAEKTLSKILPLLVAAVIIDAGICILMGVCIVWMDEVVHRCQYMNDNDGAELNLMKEHPAALLIRLATWTFLIVFAIYSIAWTSTVTSKSLRDTIRENPNDDIVAGDNKTDELVEIPLDSFKDSLNL